MDAELKKLAEMLKEKGFIVTEDSNDIDRVRPEITITISGFYRTSGEEAMHFNPPGINMHQFNAQEAEKKAEEIRKAGFGVWIHGWYSGKYTSQSSQSWQECWIYDIEIAPKEKNLPENQ